jgi:monoamine oxidase
MPNGSVIKVNAIYDRPFWRDDGLTGYAIGDRGPVRLTYDNSPPGGAPGVLVGFIEAAEANAWRHRSPSARRSAVLGTLERYFGPRAAAPVRYLEKDWTTDPWTRGCYAGYFGPHGWTRHGRALRRQVGVIHWAGTETATEWMGYMDGAVQSGERVAREILRTL